MGIVWKTPNPPKVESILLPGEKVASRTTPAVIEIDVPGSPPLIRDIAACLDRALEGKPAPFDLGNVNLSQCSPFQRSVLIAEFNIPRGRISTYGRIAAHLGIPHGARAVGNALGANPFPIIIPCHRAVRSDGSIGGYRGGNRMKRALLEREGIQFGESGKVIMNSVFY